MNWKIILLLAALVPVLKVDASNDAPLERATLRGIQAVNIVVDTLDPELVNAGVSQDTLQSRMEQRLQRAGIPLNKESNEFLGIRLTHVRAKRGPVAVCLSVGLYQPVTLSRDKEVRSVTQTWEVITVLMADAKVLNEAALNSVDELTDRFVVAYQSVNTK